MSIAVVQLKRGRLREFAQESAPCHSSAPLRRWPTVIDRALGTVRHGAGDAHHVLASRVAVPSTTTCRTPEWFAHVQEREVLTVLSALGHPPQTVTVWPINDVDTDPQAGSRKLGLHNP